jgi:DNA polymerase-3 subunit delta'
MSDTKIETKSDPNHPLPGNKRIVGQKKARIQIKQILDSGRISHAYLLTGQPGVGKLPLALTFAEYMSGVEHLSTLGDAKKTNKTSWLRILIFIFSSQCHGFIRQKNIRSGYSCWPKIPTK